MTNYPGWGNQPNFQNQHTQQASTSNNAWQNQQVQQANPDQEYDWDGVITKDSEEYIILEPGDYQFYVERFERGRYAGGEKMGPCNMATLFIRIYTEKSEQGYVTIRHNLFLHSKCEGMLSAFFTSIGQKRKGEPLKMNWNSVPGSTGWCRIGTKEYNGNKYNEIKRFLSEANPNVVPF